MSYPSIGTTLRSCFESGPVWIAAREKRKIDYVFDIPGAKGSASSHMTPTGKVCEAPGLTVMAMPPGHVDVRLSSIPVVLNVLPYAGDTLYRLRHDDTDYTSDMEAGRRGVLYTGGEVDVACESHDWACLVEIERGAVPALMAERFDGRSPLHGGLSVQIDEGIFALARMIVEHLRFERHDTLYLEGLAIALVTRSFSFERFGGRPSALGGMDARISRAIEYVEENLADDLSIARLSSIAVMSPSWFQQCFRQSMGIPVHAHVRKRRLERARRLLQELRQDKRASIQQIAFLCGFADQSHLTRAFRKEYGVTPAQARSH